MTEISWIKLSVNLFDDEKIKLIKSMPEGEAIVLIWVQLLCLAGKTNDNGYVSVGQNLYYTDEMLSTICGKSLSTIRLALTTFSNFGMIELYDNGLIYIENWEKYQSADAMRKIREQTRKRVQKYREKKEIKQKTGNLFSQETVENRTPLERLNSNDFDDCNVTVTLRNATDKNKNKNILNILSNDKIFVPLIQKWNELPDTISKISTMKKDTQRFKMLSQRINEYGSDKILEAIDKIKQSPFLLGQNNSGWTITFEWFVRPNNFIKVLEGNYIDKKINKGNFTKGKYIEQQDILTEEEKAELMKNQNNGTRELLEKY